MNHQWLRVNRQQPCVVCGKDHWCLYSPELNLVLCMRVQSERLAKNGGWLHPLDGKHKIIPVRHDPAPTLFRPQVYFEWKSANNTPMEAQQYLNGLGVDPHAWYRLGACWAAPHKAWAFPMQDGNGEIIGVQLRYLDGSKRAFKGSKNGLFVPDQPASGFALVCEGASDTAAAISMGYYAVGRQSCSGSIDMLRDLCERKGIKELAFVSDNDHPGVNGAMKASETISLPHVFVIPPAKDLREFYQSGGNRDMLNCLIQQSIWRQPC